MFFAQRADHPDEMVAQLLTSIHLSDIFSKVRIKSLYLWGDKDEKLGFNGNAVHRDYENFIQKDLVNNPNLSYEMLPGISHYMNLDSKRTVYWAGDNLIIKNRILSFVNRN